MYNCMYIPVVSHWSRKVELYNYRLVPLKPNFFGSMKICLVESNPAYPVIFSLVYVEKLPWQKIWLNQESSLTDVWLYIENY